MAEAVKKKNMVPITLDKLEWGTEEDMQAELKKSRKERKVLPDTIESRQLYKDIVNLAWPSLCELFLTSLVSMADQMMVGRLGTWATSAVSLATNPRFLFMTATMALNTGATAMVSRARGMQDKQRADAIFRQAFMFATIFGIVFGVLGYFTSEFMIRFMAGKALSDTAVANGTAYLQIQFIFFPMLCWTLCISAILKGTGQTRPSMIYNTIANVVNVILNYLLIYGNFGFPRMEVAGASLATGIGSTVACAMAFWCAFSGRFYARLHMNLKTMFQFDKSIIKGIVSVGVPSMIEQLIMRVGMVIFSRTVASLGDVDFATHNICMNIQSMSFMLGQGFAVSSTSLVGQSLGKRRLDMAEHYSRRCRNLSLCIACCLGVLFALFGKYIVQLYNNTDPQVAATGAKIMIFVACLQPVQSNQFVLSGSLRGAGDTKFTAFVSLITVVGIRTALGLLCVSVFHWGIIGAWIAVAADQVVRTVLITWRYNQGKWKSIRL